MFKFHTSTSKLEIMYQIDRKVDNLLTIDW